MSNLPPLTLEEAEDVRRRYIHLLEALQANSNKLSSYGCAPCRTAWNKLMAMYNKPGYHFSSLYSTKHCQHCVFTEADEGHRPKLACMYADFDGVRLLDVCHLVGLSVGGEYLTGAEMTVEERKTLKTFFQAHVTWAEQEIARNTKC